MRLQLVSLAAFLLASGSAEAQEEDVEPGKGTATVRSAIYADSDSTLVATNIVDAEVAATKELRVGAHVLIDQVSSASVDVVTAATGRFDETRWEGGFRGDYALPRKMDLDVGYVSSMENDWRSHAVQVGLSKRLAQDNATLRLSYGGVANRVGRSGDPNFSDSMSVHTGQVGLTQLIDPESLVSVTYFVQRASGFQSSPYRFAATQDLLMVVPESHAATRVRHAASLDYRRYLSSQAALTASYRLYLDDWGVMSHTASVRGRYVPSDAWSLEAWSRGYTQSAADFYEWRYARAQRYMSNDRELSTFWDVSLGGKAEWQQGDLALDAKIEGIYYRFLEFLSLPSRAAIVSSLGVRYQW